MRLALGLRKNRYTYYTRVLNNFAEEAGVMYYVLGPLVPKTLEYGEEGHRS